MPKDAKTDAQWQRDLCDLARERPISLRGTTPPTTSKFYADYTKIIKCPAWDATTKISTQLTLFGGLSKAGECNCGYKDYHGRPRVADSFAMIRNAQPYSAPDEAPAPAAKPPPEIPYGIPEVPTARKSKAEVRDVNKTYRNNGQFPLLMFGYTCGKCPHCGSSNISDTSLNLTPKIIHTSSWPRFVQGLGMKCGT